MKPETQLATGETAALKYAIDVVTQKLGYSRKKLTRDYPTVNLNTLRRIFNREEIKPYNQNFYMNLFTRILLHEYHECIRRGDTGRQILRMIAQIHCIENGLNIDEE